jgi:hypothetical protein
VSTSGGLPPKRALGGVTLAIRSNFEVQWFQIAVTHLVDAQEARKRSEAAPAESSDLRPAIDDETRATMIVIAATAFAIDALYAKLNELLDKADRIRCRTRVGTIVETLKRTLDLGPRTGRWTKSVHELFDLRDDLVHFEGEDRAPEPHPTGKTHVSWESARYTVEKAVWAVDLAREVLTVAYTEPRSKHKKLVAWAASNKHVPAAYFDELTQSAE